MKQGFIGKEYRTIPYTIDYPARINKGWGTSSRDFYVVGTNGLIAHYDGARWRRLESGTDVTINDIFGATNNKTGKKLILCSASNKYTVGERKILQINEQKQVIDFKWNINRRVHSIWFLNENLIYACGAGVFEKKLNGKWREIKTLPLIYTNRIRGNAYNDIFVAGDFGIVAHFNGYSWFLYSDVAGPLYYSADYKGNIFMAVGYNYGTAAVLIMKKK